MRRLLIVPNMPVVSNSATRACVYIDWDNIQVSNDNITPFLLGINKFIHDVKMHRSYITYVFLHSRISPIIKETLRRNKANIVLIVKNKSRNSDEEIIRFIRRNTTPGDSICVASGDRDFSPLMVEYVHNMHNVFLVYNTQALYTFKHNHHWLGSADCRNFIKTKPKVARDTKKYGTKPCKYYNLDRCNTVSCSYLHICGICGRPHKMQDFHAGATILKSTVCKKYNMGICTRTPMHCDHLHICSRCKQPHPYTQCKFIIMYCPICNILMKSSAGYVQHHLGQTHVKKLNIIKRIMTPKKHVLIID